MSTNDNFRKYRASTLGQTLGQTLLSFIEESQLTKKEAAAILELFDEKINSAVNIEVPVSEAAREATEIEGELDYYNFYGGLWHLRVKNAHIKTRGRPESAISSLSVLAEENPFQKRNRTNQNRS